MSRLTECLADWQNRLSTRLERAKLVVADHAKLANHTNLANHTTLANHTNRPHFGCIDHHALPLLHSDTLGKKAKWLR